MKKNISLFLIAVFVLTCAPIAYSAATKANALRYGSSSTPSLTDASTGNTADVSQAGDLYVRRRPASVTMIRAGSNTLKQRGALSGGANVQSFTFTGQLAGALVLISDSTTAGGTQLFEIETSAAKSTVHIGFPSGVRFNTEVFCQFDNADDVLSITYDTDAV